VLTALLGSKSRSRLLEILLLQPGSRFYVRELMRLTGLGASSVQRELAHLEQAGVITSEREGTNRYFRADPTYHLAAELTALTRAAQVTARDATAAQAGPARVPNPRVAGKMPAVADACRRRGVRRLAVFGSAVDGDPATVPGDLDLAVTFRRMAPEERGRAYLDLMRELEEIMGMRVDVVVDDSVHNPYLRQAIDDTQVVVYDAA
jgi:predicted nucleotidyltransferase